MRLAVSHLTEVDARTESVIVDLWDACDLTRPWNDPRADIRRAVAAPSGTLLVGREGERIIATVMAGYDGHRAAVYYLAVAPGRVRQGFGRVMMASAEDWLTAQGAPKLNLMVRPENADVAAFYRALGYAVEERLVLAKRLG